MNRKTCCSVLCSLSMLLWGYSYLNAQTETQDFIFDSEGITEEIRAKSIIPIHLAKDITLKRELLYNKYTLKDTYTYGKKRRQIQWGQIRSKLALVENMLEGSFQWGVVQNYKNLKGKAPHPRNARIEGKNVFDSLGVERYQAIPLYEEFDLELPQLYARDGWIALNKGLENEHYRIYPIELKREFLVPKEYFNPLPDTVAFDHVLFIDRKRQYIVTVERTAPQKWSIRSVNPSTTGMNKPPYSQETPLGMFLLQGKREKMIYLKDGSNTEIGGFAPYASRFTGGAYVHGVPTVHPGEEIIEYSSSLGTRPLSHMCVRTPSSHAAFIYGWAPTRGTIIFVIE